MNQLDIFNQPAPITLHPFQDDLIDGLTTEAHNGARRLLLQAATGAGKTVVASRIIRHAASNDQRTLFLCHRRELVFQCSKKLDAFGVPHGIIMSGDPWDPTHRVNVASIQTLHSRVVRRRREEFPKADLVVVDECFPAGTQIDGRPIESLIVGDTVKSFNDENHVIEEKKIKRLFRSDYTGDWLRILDSSGREIVCTENHPIWTLERGYVSAKSLLNLNGDSATLLTNELPMVQKGCTAASWATWAKIQILRYQMLWACFSRQTEKKYGAETAQSCSNSILLYLQEKSRLRPTNNKGISENWKAILFSFMLRDIPVAPQLRVNAKNEFKGSGDIEQEDEKKQPILRSGNTENYSREAQGEDLPFQGREREIHGTANGDAHGQRIADGVSNLDGQGQGLFSKFTAMLQGGFGRSVSKAGDRGRRSFPSNAILEILGQKENGNFELSRLGSVEIYKRGSEFRPPWVPEKNTVYNFEVEGNNNYFASGILVHNCHHTNSSKTWIDILTAYPESLILGMTATPINRRGKGLGHFFDAMVCGPSIQWLVDQGYLVPARYFIPSPVDLRGLRIVAGDYVESELEERLDAPKLIGDIVENWARFGEGRQTLVFASGVKHSLHLAETFNKAGVPAGHVDGETPKEDRDRIVKEFSDGKLKVLANCFDAETEILTNRGWVRGAGLLEDDVIAAVNPGSGALSWEVIERIVRRERAPSERMVRVKNQTLDLRVTEGHRMLVRTRGAKKWRIVEAKDLPTKASPYDFRVAARGEFTGVPLDPCDLEFLGLFSTDGSLNRERASIEIAQSAASPICQEIERILTSCGFDWKVSESKRKTPAGEVRSYRIYRIPKGNIGGKLKRNGWNRLEFWLDKSLSPKLADCSVEQFKSLLHGLWLGDGTKTEWRTRKNPGTTICSADRLQMDRIQEWAVLRGMACSQTWLANTSGGRYPDSVIGYLRVRNRDTVGTNNCHVATSGGNPARFEDEWCQEIVWCVSNKTGTVIVRRNGRVMVAGQCAVFTEGTDIPSASCLVFARPTKSLLLYLQVAGRVLRTFPGKASAIVLDHAGVVYEHGPVAQEWDWKLEYGEGDVRQSTRDKTKLPKEITCGECKAVYWGRLACPECGWIPKIVGKEIQTYHGYLQALDEINNPPPVDKQTFYRMLLGYCVQKEKKTGLAFYKFQDKFGEKPPWSWKNLEPIEPNAEVSAWLLKEQRLYFWKQKNPDLANKLGMTP